MSQRTHAFTLSDASTKQELPPLEFELDEQDRALSERIRDGLQQHVAQQNAREIAA